MFRKIFITMAFLSSFGAVHADTTLSMTKDEAFGQAQQCIKVITTREDIKLHHSSADELARLTVEYFNSELNRKDLYPIEFIDCDSEIWMGITINLFNFEPKFKIKK